MKAFSKIISWVFLPLLMPIYGLALTMFIPSESISALEATSNLYRMPLLFKVYILIMFLVLTVLAPSFSLLMMKRSNSISNVELDVREERSFPIGVTVIYCAILGVFLWTQIPKEAIPSVIFALPWVGVVGSVIAGLINRIEKISLHALGAGMLFGFLAVYFRTQSEFYVSILILSVVVGGIVMSSRLYLEKHTLREVITGYALGTIVSISVLTFFANWLGK